MNTIEQRLDNLERLVFSWINLKGEDMAKFNRKKVSIIGPDTVNVAGGEAFQESLKLELVSLLLTSMVQDRFYRSASQELNRLTTLVDALIKDDEAYFIAQAGVYARRTFGLRSITHVLAALLARRVRGASWTKDFYNAIIARPDDLTEIMALVLATGNNVPNALKDGFAKALGRISGYGLAKYKGEKRAVHLVDVVNLTHPVGNESLDKLMNGRLETAQTWEAGMSEIGQELSGTAQQAVNAELWTDLIKKKKIGYLALLRNLRNILKMHLAEDVLTMVAERLTDEKAIKKSMIFPFQFQTAYDVVSAIDSTHTRMFMKVLNEAAEISLNNVPVFEGDTLIAMDLSGSMVAPVGTSTAAKVGGLFAASLWKSNENSDLMIFGSDATYFNTMLLDTGLFQIAQVLSESDRGGTNFHEIFKKAKRRYDRIIIISDCQAWEQYHTPKEALKDYQKKFNVIPHIYSMDLCGLGTLQFPENKVYAIAGFSDKIFDVMQTLETDRQALIHTIEKVDIREISNSLLKL